MDVDLVREWSNEVSLQGCTQPQPESVWLTSRHTLLFRQHSFTLIIENLC